MLIKQVMEVWHLNLRQLRAAAAVAELGTVSAAAKAVNISQPAITQGLAKMEAALGLLLFERLPDGMRLTQAGELFVPRIQGALVHVASHRVTMTQLRALIVIAEAGSYVRAARITNLSQPSLHRAVRDLSIALRQELLVRRGRGIALTEKGKFHARAFRLAKSELEAGINELSALLGHEKGRIVIGAMPLSRARVLPEALSRFHVSHPEIPLSVVEGSFHELIEPLLDGEIDLMVGAQRDAAMVPEVDQQLLFIDRPTIIGRKGHPALAGERSLQDLARFPWVIPARGTPLRAQWETMFEDVGISVPDVPIECGSPITIRQIMLESDFLTLLSPDQFAIELKTGLLARVADVPEGMTRQIGLFTRTDWRPTALQSAFMEILKSAAASD